MPTNLSSRIFEHGYALGKKMPKSMIHQGSCYYFFGLFGLAYCTTRCTFSYSCLAKELKGLSTKGPSEKVVYVCVKTTNGPLFNKPKQKTLKLFFNNCIQLSSEFEITFHFTKFFLNVKIFNFKGALKIPKKHVYCKL